MPYLTEDNAFFYEGKLQPLHRCKVPQKRYTSQLADVLIENFRDMVASTKEEAPGRTKYFKFDRSKDAFKPDNKSIERILEHRLYKTYSERGSINLGIDGEVISNIPSYQIPLAAHGTKKRENVGWGKVDLIGCSENNEPIIIELKKAESNESPLRMIVEGLAYAIAVQKMWNNGNGFKNEWFERIKATTDKNAPKLKRIQVIGLAPKLYWKRWLEGAPGFSKLDKPSIEKIGELIQKANNEGYPIDFASYEKGNDNAAPSGIKMITDKFLKATQ